MMSQSSSFHRHLAGRESAAPFLIERGRVGALLIHGLAASPFDLRTFGESLAAQNVSVYSMQVAGHGQGSEALKQSTPSEWRRSVDDALATLREYATTIFAVGDSFGGNLAIDCALRAPHALAGIVTLGTPITMHRDLLTRLFVPFAHRFQIHYRKSWLSPVDHARNERKGSLNDVPLKSIKEFLHFLQETKRQLPRLSAPLLVFCATQDPVIHPSSAEYLFRHTGTSDKQLFWIKGKKHHVLESSHRDRIVEQIIAFILSHAPQAFQDDRSLSLLPKQ